MTIFILTLVIIAILIMSIKVHGSILTPWAVYLSSWISLILLYNFDWFVFTKVSNSTWIIILISMFTYILGTLFVYTLNRIIKIEMLVVKSKEYWFNNVSENKYNIVLIIITMLGFVGSFGYYTVINNLYGIDTYIYNPGFVRGSQGEDNYVSAFYWWKFAFYMNWLSIPLCISRLVISSNKSKRWLWLMLILQILINITLVSRGHILFISLVGAYVLTSSKRNNKLRWELVAITTVILVTVIYFIFVGDALGKTSDYIISSGGGFYGKDSLSPFAGIYMYVVGNLPALDAFISNKNEYTYGAFIMLPLMKLLTHLNIIKMDIPSEVGEFYEIPMPFNTHTYLDVYYSDFGFIGIIVMPFLFGYFSNKIYLKSCIYGKVWHVIGSAILVHASLSSIGTNVLISTPQWEYAIVLIFISIYTNRKIVMRKNVNINQDIG